MAFFNFNNVLVSGIASAIPKYSIQLSSFKTVFGEDTIRDFSQRTGVYSKHITREEQTTSDLGYVAAKGLIKKKGVALDEIGVLLFISKTPDYRSPATAIVLQHRLNLSKDVIAYDINIGSAGFIYGMEVGCSLIESLPVKKGLIIIGDTISKQISANNPISMLFGDGASAILLEKKINSSPIKISSGALGSEYKSFILKEGGFRMFPHEKKTDLLKADITNHTEEISIDYPKFHSLAYSVIPEIILSFLDKSNTSINDFDIIALHQESLDVLENIAEKTGIPKEKIRTNLDKFGNTCGASIPLLLSDVYGSVENNRIQVLSCGFGEGFSFGVTSFFVEVGDIFPVIETDYSYSEGSVGREI